MSQFYVYLHCRPDGIPFYVGKGTGKRSHKLLQRNQHHQRIINKHGAENIEVLVFPRDSELDAFWDEMKWIGVLRDAGIELVNKTCGGEGSSGRILSIETRNKISVAAIGRKRSTESRAKQAATLTGRKRPLHHCEKMIAASKGLKPMLGKKHSPEAIEKISAAKIGKKRPPFSDEWRANISATVKGKPSRRKGIPNVKQFSL